MLAPISALASTRVEAPSDDVEDCPYVSANVTHISGGHSASGSGISYSAVYGTTNGLSVHFVVTVNVNNAIIDLYTEDGISMLADPVVSGYRTGQITLYTDMYSTTVRIYYKGANSSSSYNIVYVTYQ